MIQRLRAAIDALLLRKALESSCGYFFDEAGA